MCWRDFICKVHVEKSSLFNYESKPLFFLPCSQSQIEQLEKQFNVKLPESLCSLYLESDGVSGCRMNEDGRWMYDLEIPWTISECIEQNEYYRTEGQSDYSCNFKDMFFFADAGADCILFGFQVLDSRACDPAVMVWDPIPNEWRQSAPDLKTFIKGWLTSTISV